MTMEETIVFTTWDEPMADMAVGLLEAEGISARKRTVVARSVHPFSVDGLGEIQICVPEEEAEIALDIIAARFSERGITPEDISEADI